MSRRTLRELLRQQFPDQSRDSLFALLHAGQVQVDGVVQRDGNTLFDENVRLVLLSEKKHVSRGYHKLEAAVQAWDCVSKDSVWIDAGASTGGFTECLLDYGAAAVHAVDVGYNQLDYRLRQDSRVLVHERCNIMQPREYLPEPDMFSMDLSFRSALGPVTTLMPYCRSHKGIVLLKPQFEWQNPPDWFTGIVPDEKVDEIVAGVFALWEENGLSILASIPSPIRGKQGNQEFLVMVSG